MLDWVKEWLTGRTQRVLLNGKQSGVGEVRSGVVQGSTLGPTLFLIFINEISSALKDGVSALDMTSSILSEWSRTWQLHFNTSKCKVMHIGKCGTHSFTHHFLVATTKSQSPHSLTCTQSSVTLFQNRPSKSLNLITICIVFYIKKISLIDSDMALYRQS